MPIRIFRATLPNQNSPIYYPKQQFCGYCDDQLIAEILEKRTTFTKGDIHGLLYALGELMSEYLLRGYHFKINTMGVFYPIMEYINKVEDADENFAASNIRMKSIKFQPQQSQLRRLKNAQYERASVQQTTLSSDERCQNIRSFIEQNGFISRKSAAGINRCSTNTASRDLKALQNKGEIKLTNNGVYTF